MTEDTMTDEGIDYHPIGTITVRFDNESWTLGRPKLRQWRYFTRRIEEMSTGASTRLNDLAAAVAIAQGVFDEDPSEVNAKVVALAQQELSDFARVPFYETSSELVREMFAQLGDRPLPEELDDWPTWLAADVSLPGQFLAHWRKAPKASGSNGTT